MLNTQVRADEAMTSHEENNYGLFSLSADTGTAKGSSLLLYTGITIGLEIIGMYLQYKTWKANRTTKTMLKGGKSSSSTLLPKLPEQKETPAPAPAPSPIVVRPPPCPCS